MNENRLYEIFEHNDEKARTVKLCGDVQLGKRIHACFYYVDIFIYVYTRPELYICVGILAQICFNSDNDIQGTDELCLIINLFKK